jgi:hypothetical protein
MFEQIDLFMSFVFALAITHILSTVTELILARDRVIVSGPYAIWMLNAVILLLTNWLALGNFKEVTHWTLGSVMTLFIIALTLYLICAAMAIKVRENEPVDMPAFFARNRFVIFGAWAVGRLSVMAANYVFRDLTPVGAAWVKADATILVGLAVIAVAAFAKPKWLQWTAALLYAGMSLAFVANFTLPKS